MKCSFCGKELEQGAEFCPECGMILSLGGVTNEPEEKPGIEEDIEIPEYTPNVFRAMDFEQEPDVPAMELEVIDEEETAVVVEAIPEFVAQEDEQEVVEVAEAEVIEEAEAAQEEAEEPVEEAQEEAFAAPEYDPNAEVSAEFMQQASEEAEEVEEVEEAFADEVIREEFAPPEYDGNVGSDTSCEIAEAEETVSENAENEPSEESYPAYSVEEEIVIPEENLTEDDSLFASLFESDDEAERLEDITPGEEKPVKKNKSNFAAVAVLIVVLVGVICAGGFVFKNVLPKVMDRDKNTTTSAATGEVDATTKAPEKTNKG